MWLDETGCNRKDHNRRCGYSLRGEPPVYHRFLIRGTRISAIASLCTDGIVEYTFTDGTVNGEIGCGHGQLFHSSCSGGKELLESSGIVVCFYHPIVQIITLPKNSSAMWIFFFKGL